MITHLPVTVPRTGVEPPGAPATGHPMRIVTRNIAFLPGWWNAEHAAEVEAFFDDLAPEWTSRDVPGREAPVLDALDRGIAAAPVADRRVCVDVGAGTGLYSRFLVPRFPTLVSLDLSLEMLRHAPPATVGRVQGDASRLPVADGSVDVLLLANAFLFPDEVERVLAPAGVVVWVNSRGDQTPIHLPADDVDAALPGPWAGVASEAGWGTWAVVWRSPAS